jgi:hypothetical protein
MRVEKIEFVLNPGRKANQAEADPAIAGNNFFSGKLSAEKAKSGFFGMTIDNQKDWEMCWKQTGNAPPGDLPEGACAKFTMQGENKEFPEISLPLLEKGVDGVTLSWLVTKTPMEEEGSYSSFACILLPKYFSIIETFDYKVLPSPAEELAAEIASFSPGLRRPLPAKRPLKL